MPMPSKSYCLVTPTYRGDIAAFRDLCDSIDRHMPEITHYVLVDRSDVDIFRSFGTERRIVVDCSDELPQFKEFQLFGRRVWWRWPRHLVRGWIYQQIVKIHFSARLQEQAAILIDSDAILIKPITPEQVFDGDRVKLYHRANADNTPEFRKWHNVALKSFGLPETGYTGFNYISTAVIWSPRVVRAMIARIESETGRKWHDELIRPFRFSEYIQYGIFCDHIAGEHQDWISPVEEEICHCSWHYDVQSKDGVAKFLNEVQNHNSAILIQSNLCLDEKWREYIIDEINKKFEI